MKSYWISAMLLTILTQPALAQPAPARTQQRYLAGNGVDLRAFIPTPPEPGTWLDRRDRETFLTGRAPADSPRWQQAINDVDEAVPAMLADFSKATGRTLTPGAYPALARLLLTMRPDAAAAVNAVKPLYARPRPFLRDDGPVCEDKQQLSHSYDYPSGHTSWGTSVGLVLAELFPERGDAILQRARDYGNSRVICGAHSVSAVEAGRQAAAAIVAGLHGSPRFRKDLEAARSEVSRAR